MGQNNYIRVKQWIDFEGDFINLTTVTAVKCFYSETYNKWLLGYCTNTGTWMAVAASSDEKIIKEKYEQLKQEILR